MDLSLSISSFPIDEQTANDMTELLVGLSAEARTVLHPTLWRGADSRGFAVLAYTEQDELIGFASAADMVGLHHYEWSLYVHPDYRRLALGTALADGISHGLAQRQAESELVAFVNDVEISGFMESLAYDLDFHEILLSAEPLSKSELPNDLTIAPFAGQAEELTELLTSAFDDTILPILEHNMIDPEREIWLLQKDQQLFATATLVEEEKVLWITAFAVHPDHQGKGYGKQLLKWCRELAHERTLNSVYLDVETDNQALHVYEKSGFVRMQTVSYWKSKTD
ncbi:acetyltransferase, GNAT family protein [Planococcus halocryophilus Or1]|uniref:GNAT family N-acetyltransferase n=1 Tax=Planococcus halocryophilus TaxID=1215089 RepID=A0A1C7DRU8_9BACL|nr:GNAT family N-acetyltransferase [Planococcus halocryophilus]ANU14117.1 GNAT family N-acetyltransferase [Planococcus halocryophilus]EMF47284.1 acetyltransferase, GNAT family protein [Planococcus halocryophilus Or1]